MLAFNNKCSLIGVFQISHGTVNSSLLSPREIFIRATLSTATRIVLIHNHPSGDPAPSAEDIKITKRVREAGELLQIELMYHIIIGDSFISLKSEGYF